MAKDVDPEVIEGLKMNFVGECTEVGMYLAIGDKNQVSQEFSEMISTESYVNWTTLLRGLIMHSARKLVPTPKR